ncbi:MAG: T9SS type A sorting domain-containing protein [Bacteroidetes bacterium]|nr:T9SS type A sorting domain-containing protein [Bacteroidota bacterium]
MDQKTTTLKNASRSRRTFRWLAGLIGLFVLLLSSGTTMAQEYESLLKSDSMFNDTIDHLIISEWRGDSWQTAYIELCNMGDTAIDLRKMAVRSLPGGKQTWDFWGPEANNATMSILFDSLKLSVDNYTLEPGETFLMAPHYDATTDDGGPIHRPELVEMADYVGYKIEKNEPNDTTSYGERFFRQWSSYPIGVFVAVRVTDTIPPFYQTNWVLVDNINGDRDPVSNNIGLGVADVAGFFEATGQAVLVRKHTITKGTLEGEWTAAASDDITTSEWIPIKHDDQNLGGKVFKTAGNHGNFTMDVTAGEGVTMDLVNGTLEVPWGALRGERIIDNEVILGDGMAWTYRNFSEEGDSLLDINDLSFNQVAMPGDVINLYACGDDLETAELTISYADAALNSVKIYPTYKMNDLGEWAEYYYVTDDEPTIDTIGNVPFATRIDTLIEYMDIAPNSSWALIPVTGEDHVDLVYGDKLLVTGADGSSTKEYFIDVQEYAGNPESRLSVITWPDISLQGANIGYYLQNGWAYGAILSDTLPGFSSSKLTYVVQLAPGTMDVPAFEVTTMNLNAWVKIDRAVDLFGSVENRTTTIKVTSEDSSSVSTYSILFEVFSDEIQENASDPFFSTMMMTISTRNAGLELVNPGNVELDLSRYLIVKTYRNNDPSQAIRDTMSYFNRYNKYIPGYVYKSKDTTAWNITMDYTLTKGGPNIKSKIGPGDVFVMANMHNKAAKWWKSISHTQEIDVLFFPREALVDPYYPDKSIYTPEEFDLDGAPNGGHPVDQQNHVGYARADHSFFLFKILNDSILEGTKAIIDTADFELIDAIGDPINSPGYKIGSWDMNGDSARVWEVGSGGQGIILLREPDIYHGVSKVGEGISEDHEVSQWIVGDELYWPEVEGRWTGMTQHFGTHNMEVVSVYVSTITSANYMVSTGFEGLQDVKGVVEGTTVQQFIDNITKADEEQGLQFIANANGAELGLTDVLLNSDTLHVAAADSSNFTTYVLEVTPSGLKDNAILTSTTYTVIDNDTTGTVEGMAYGTTVVDVLDNVVKDADAALTIVDGNNELLGKNVVTADGQVVLRTVTSDVYFEVVAQDKVTKMLYQLKPAMSATDAYVLSDVYEVTDLLVDGITFGISVDAFYNNITVIGRESYIEDRAGVKRSIGTLNSDDMVVVVSDDESVTVKYTLGFSGMAVNQAPGIDLVESIGANVDVLFNLAAIVSDDGLPEGSEVTVSWSVAGGDEGNVTIATPDAESTDVTISAEGVYVLELTASDGLLESKAAVSVNVVMTGLSHGNASTLEVYPNPASDKVFIDGLRINSVVTVLNMTGAVVDQFNANDGRHFIELGNQPAGTYLIKVQELNGSVRIGKVLKR